MIIDKSSCVFISLYALVPMVFSLSTKHYTFGKDCSVSIEHVNENEIAYLEYNGEDELNSWCDQMSFIGRDDDYLNEYKVCVTIEVFQDPHCAIKIHYKDDYSGVKIKTYDCYDNPRGQYCAKQDEYFYIELQAPENKFSRRDVRVKLKVEGVMVLDYYQRVGIIVGSVIGGIVFLCCCCACCIYSSRKNKGSSGHVVTQRSAAVPLTQNTTPSATNPSQTYYYPPPVTNTTGSTNTSTPGNYPSQPGAAYNPQQPNQAGGYPSNQYQTNYSTPYSPPLDNSTVEASAPPLSDFTAPPPSYESAINMQ